MINIQNKQQGWSQIDKNFIRGYAFLDHILLKENSLLTKLLDSIIVGKDQPNLCGLLKNLNGSFSAILFKNDTYYLISDKLKSFPLLFYVENDHISISDNGLWLTTQTSNLKINEKGMLYLVSAGYNCGAETVYENFFLVRAGSFVQIDKMGAFSETIYYHYIRQKITLPLSDLCDNAKHILEKAFQRTLLSIESKTVVIPLSGGYDSRLIACLCKDFGLKDVICYTYGVKGSKEVVVSENIAKKLGYPWYFVEYSDSIVRDFFEKGDFLNYFNYAANYISCCHYQDFIAVKSLLEMNIIDTNCVVIPGHSGDLFGGTHLRNIRGTEQDFSQLVLDKYFHLNQLPKSQKMILKKDLERYFASILKEYDNPLTPQELLTSWNIVSRQSNFIINSARVYEYFGLEWRVPFWDDEYANFWLNIISEKDFSLYYRFMFDFFFKKFGVDFSKEKNIFTKLLTAVKLPANLKNIIKYQLTKTIPYFKNRYGQNNVNEEYKQLFILLDNYISKYSIKEGKTSRSLLAIWHEKQYISLTSKNK